MPSSIAPMMTSSSEDSPSLWPSVLGSPRFPAQRPSPSITRATCLGANSDGMSGGFTPLGCGSGGRTGARRDPRACWVFGLPSLIRIAAWRPRPPWQGRHTASPPKKCRWRPIVCSHVPVQAAPRARPAGGAAGALRPRQVRVEPRGRAARALASGQEELPCRSEEHTSELQSRRDLVCRLLLEKKKKKKKRTAEKKEATASDEGIAT